jgi:site-specific DNA recombinase
MKIIAYCRVSTEEQANEGYSLGSQQVKLEAYCSLYSHDLVEVVVDGGQSAKTMNRPGLQRCLTALRSGQAEGLLVLKLDRLTRSVKDLSYLLEEYFFKNSNLLSVSEQIDTSTAGGRLMLNLMASISQWERECTGERTKAALQHKKSLGHRLGAPALEDPATIARLQELKGAGLTYEAIADTMNREGHPTKRGGAWHSSTVYYVLKRARVAA